MLKEGDKAPDFSLESDTSPAGKRLTLRDLAPAGKTLVLYFYPKDSTPGCTREAQAFTQLKEKIEAAGGIVAGVSRDSLKSHGNFRQKFDLGITLLSDPDLAAHKAYGAWGEKTMYGKKILGTIRSTFLVRNGKIVRVFPSVKVDGHADKVLEAIAGGGADTVAKTKTAKAPAPKLATLPKAAKTGSKVASSKAAPKMANAKAGERAKATAKSAKAPKAAMKAPKASAAKKPGPAKKKASGKRA